MAIETSRFLKRTRHFLLEMVTIIIGVSIAFWLNQWKEERNLHDAQIKSLKEIKAGLKLDSVDISGNIQGHRNGLQASQAFVRYVNNIAPIPPDSLLQYQTWLLRDFISVQNSAPYEALKAQGLSLIQNDSLRLKIISIYDFHFEIIEKLEENYAEMQFFSMYSKEINQILVPFMQFNKSGLLTGLSYPAELTSVQKNTIMLHLLKINYNRKYTIQQYLLLQEQIREIIIALDKEIQVLESD